MLSAHSDSSVEHIHGATILKELKMQPLEAAQMALALCGGEDYDAGRGLWDFGPVKALLHMPVLADYFKKCGRTDEVPTVEEVHTRPFARPSHNLLRQGQTFAESKQHSTSCAGVPAARDRLL